MFHPLPKLRVASLPNKTIQLLISLLILFSLSLSIVFPAFAQDKEVNPPTNPNQINPQPNWGEIKLIPQPDGSYKVTPGDPATTDARIQQAGCGPFSFACDLFGSLLGLVGEGVIAAINAGYELGMRFVPRMGLGSGCEQIDSAAGVQKCADKHAALLKGGTVADVQDPGGLIIAASIADKSMKMPVPISSSQYFASINPFKSVQAESGFEELSDSGIIRIWRNFRNAAYALMVVVLVIIGFLIMIRFKLDPRTSVTAVNAIPRVVVALLLITFSFAISGLMIDIARLAAQLVGRLIPINAGDFVSQIVIYLILTLATAFLLPGVGPLVALGLLLILVVFLIAVLVVLFFIIWKVLTRFATFIIFTVFSPAILLLAALPGQEGAALGFLKRQFAAIISIPAMLMMLHLAFYVGIGTFNGDVRLPAPFAGALRGEFGDATIGPLGLWMVIQPIVAFGMMFMTTKVPDIVDEMFGIRPLAPRAGIGPGVIIGAPVGGLQTLGQAGRTFEGIGRVPTVGPPMQDWIRRQFGRFCLADNINIDTPQGSVLITEIKKGMGVWTGDKFGQRVASVILKVVRTPVPAGHQVAHIILADTRELFVTSGHPTTDGRTTADLSAGDLYEGIKIV